MAWAPSLRVSLPELMEILYTWSWPLPKDTPASQRALCSADGGIRGKKEPRAIRKAAGQGEEHFSILLSAGCAWKTGQENNRPHPASWEGFSQLPGLTHHFRCEVQKEQDSSLPSCPVPTEGGKSTEHPTSPSFMWYMRGQKEISAIRASPTAPGCPVAVV